jgi:hypothetical protein
MVVRGLKTTQKSLAATVATAMLSFALVTPVAQAQETTAEVRGVVVNTSGAPLEGAHGRGNQPGYRHFKNG